MQSCGALSVERVHRSHQQYDLSLPGPILDPKVGSRKLRREWFTMNHCRLGCSPYFRWVAHRSDDTTLLSLRMLLYVCLRMFFVLRFTPPGFWVCFCSLFRFPSPGEFLFLFVSLRCANRTLYLTVRSVVPIAPWTSRQLQLVSHSWNCSASSIAFLRPSMPTRNWASATAVSLFLEASSLEVGQKCFSSCFSFALSVWCSIHLSITCSVVSSSLHAVHRLLFCFFINVRYQLHCV